MNKFVEQQSFCYQNNFSGKKAQYANWCISWLCVENRYLGENPGQDQLDSLADEMITEIRKDFGMGPISWFFLQWVVVPIVKLAIRHWLQNL